jgi:hypothetical protein
MLYLMDAAKAILMFLAFGPRTMYIVDANSLLETDLSSLHEIIASATENVQPSLLQEVDAVFSIGTISSRFAEMESALRPMFVALPKNEHGHLGRAAVRYALHRFFVQRHGWFVNGLYEVDDRHNSTSTPGLLKERVPAYVIDIFEERLNAQGFGLHELAVLAATIEQLVHNEVVKRLSEAFKVHSLTPAALMNETEVDDVLDTYMAGHILGEDFSNMTTKDALRTRSGVQDVFNSWSATQKFVRDLRKNITGFENRSAAVSFDTHDFPYVAHVAQTVAEQFGRFQNLECRQIKANLTAMEEAGTGRVRLFDFWKPAIDNPDAEWNFGESRNYLRQLGALDESDTQTPRVMIANYINSPSNCIASSSLYAVCCMNECEQLIGHLEKQIAAPEASPDVIASLVAKLPSASLQSPRSLSKTLLSRLDDISTNGVVQLHGRLFAQWMHHAYPRECPYPHISGTTKPQTPDEWLKSTGEQTLASSEEMKAFVDKAKNNAQDFGADSLLWSPDEELLVAPLVMPSEARGNIVTSSARNVLLVAAIIAITNILLRTVAVDPNAKSERLSEKVVYI